MFNWMLAQSSFDTEQADDLATDFWAEGQAGAWLQEVSRILAAILVLFMLVKQGLKLLGGRGGGMGGEGGGMTAALKGLLPALLFGITHVEPPAGVRVRDRHRRARRQRVRLDVEPLDRPPSPVPSGQTRNQAGACVTGGG